MKIDNDTILSIGKPNDLGTYSKSDLDIFNAHMNRRTHDFGQQDNLGNLNKKLIETSMANARMTIESSLDYMAHNAITEKNTMILKARGSAVKKATEVSKDISF